MVEDVHGEFCIRKRADLHRENIATDFNNTYWEEQYTVVDRMVFSPIVSSSSKLLFTGKYWNVLQEANAMAAKSKISSKKILCQTSMNGPSISFSVHANDFAEKINAAFDVASSNLLQLLLEEKNLMARTRYSLF